MLKGVFPLTLTEIGLGPMLGVSKLELAAPNRKDTGKGRTYW